MIRRPYLKKNIHLKASTKLKPFIKVTISIDFQLLAYFKMLTHLTIGTRAKERNPMNVQRVSVNRSIDVKIKRFLLLAAGLVLSQYGYAQNALISLDSIDFSSLPNSAFEISLGLSGQPKEPMGYVIENPSRIVLDFPGVVSNLKEKRYPLSFDNADSTIVLSSNNRTRLVINLEEKAQYQTHQTDDKFVILVGKNVVPNKKTRSTSNDIRPAVAQSAQPAVTQKVSSKARSTVDNIDFRRGEQGEGRVILSLSDSSVNVDIEENARGIVVNLIGAKLPETLRRRLDVTDFGTPVSFIDAKHQNGISSIFIDPNGEYEYLAYQADNEYVVSLKPLSKEEIEEKAEAFRFSGDRLSLNFQDIEVRAVLQLIADFTQLNLVASDTVNGKITLRLDNVPWDQALDIVLKAKGLDKRQMGNVLMVAPATEIANRERQELETRKQLQELAPLRTEHIRVLYANARELYKLFDIDTQNPDSQGATSSILSERGNAIVDERTNSIILTDTEDKIEAFKKLVRQIDIPIQQVLIEARIVSASTDFAREIGVQWQQGTVHSGGTGNSAATGGYNSYIGGNLNNGRDNLQAGNLLTGDFGAVDLGVTTAASRIAFGYVTNDYLVGLELSALESEGIGEVISQPKVVTGDKQTAVIRSGSEIPFQEASASGATTTAYREATLRLEVTPQITPDDHIILDLAVNQDAVGEVVAFGASSAPTIDVTEVQTQVLVKNGETIVLGGIFQSVETVSESKVPLLGDIPVVGNLFKRNSRDLEKTELLIFITPRLLQDPGHRS